MFELKDFQQKSVDYIYSRFKEKDCQRFCVLMKWDWEKQLLPKGNRQI